MKHWRFVPENAPIRDTIPSFGIEIILTWIFRNKNPSTLSKTLLDFFDYVIKSRLQHSLGLHRGGQTLTTFGFDDVKREFLIDWARDSRKLLIRDPPDLSFLGL